MTYLFIFAHPDDETVACAGTIKKLTDAGEKVVLVSVTPGDAGEVVTAEAQQKVKELGSLRALREQEFGQVCELLGVAESRILGFADGTITNQMVWAELKEAIIDVIDEIKPDVLVTFDHTGWYYHLDHIGTSIATTLAYHQAQHSPEALFLSHFFIPQAKWVDMYGLKDQSQVSHRVDIADVLEVKFRTLQQHNSQDLNAVKTHFEQHSHYEEFDLIFSTQKGKDIIEHNSIFEKVK